MTTPAATTMPTPTWARPDTMLTDLRRPTIKRLAGSLCAQSDKEGWPAPWLLEALLEHEINEREARREDRHRGERNLSPDMRISSFGFSAVLSVSKAQVMALAEGTQWLEGGANVLRSCGHSVSCRPSSGNGSIHRTMHRALCGKCPPRGVRACQQLQFSHRRTAQ